VQKRPRIIKPRSSPVTENRGFDLILIAIGLHLCFSLSPYDCIQRIDRGLEIILSACGDNKSLHDIHGFVRRIRETADPLPTTFITVLSNDRVLLVSGKHRSSSLSPAPFSRAPTPSHWQQ
jgi:hypothetical protein